jgi:hypothetical protein
MLIVVWGLTFFASHYAFGFLLTLFDQRLPTSMAGGAAVVTYVVGLLALCKLSARFPLSNPHVPVALAFGGLLGMLVPVAVFLNKNWSVGFSEESSAGVALLFGFTIVWGVCTMGLISAVFGTAARAHWDYVRETYSTFRKG